jgi:hypothetical protein
MATQWGARDQLLVDIVQTAQKRIKKAVISDSEASKLEIDRLCAPIAEKFNGLLSFADVKSQESAVRKVSSDYGGDWYSIRDLARITIIISDPTDCPALIQELKNVFTASKGRGVTAIKFVNPNDDKCGYSGVSVFVKTTNQRPAEIQINQPRMIYAKQKPKSVKKILGENFYLNTKVAYQLEAGMGHKLYELYRVLHENSDRAKHIAKISRAYYDLFRGYPNHKVAAELQSQLEALLGPHLGLETA